MTEDELEQRRKEFRDKEVENKIENYKQVGVVEYRQSTLKHHYTYKRVDTSLPKIFWFLIISQAVFLVFFVSLYSFSFFQKTKFITAAVMP